MTDTTPSELTGQQTCDATTALVYDTEAMAGASHTPRAVENIAAFPEKRGPVWTHWCQRGPLVRKR